MEDLLEHVLNMNIVFVFDVELLVFSFDLLILSFHMLVFCFLAFHITPASRGYSTNTPYVSSPFDLSRRVKGCCDVSIIEHTRGSSPLTQESIVPESREDIISLQAYTAQHNESWESLFYRVTFTSTSRRQPNNRSKAPAIF